MQNLYAGDIGAARMVSAIPFWAIVAVVMVRATFAHSEEKPAVQTDPCSIDSATEKVSNWPHWRGPNADGVADWKNKDGPTLDAIKRQSPDDNT